MICLIKICYSFIKFSYRTAYVLCSKGKIKINGKEIVKGDGAEITEEKNVKIEALEDAEVLFIDLPKYINN